MIHGPRRIGRDEFLMQMARTCARRSTCKTRNGAVLVKGRRVIAMGYNGSPPGQPHCIDVGCLKDVTRRCTRTIHAEINVILMAARYGISTEGAALYCTTAPCPNCSKLLTNSGIGWVMYERIYHNQYTTAESVSILHKCGIKVLRYAKSTRKG